MLAFGASRFAAGALIGFDTGLSDEPGVAHLLACKRAVFTHFTYPITTNTADHGSGFISCKIARNVRHGVYCTAKRAILGNVLYCLVKQTIIDYTSRCLENSVTCTNVIPYT